MAGKRSRNAFEADLQKKDSPFVIYGTPLPPLDDRTRDDGSFVPIWKQEVTDDRGRKRLHGAFTGGFSAGYYNTVGSKEGWTPSTFVSSRQNRRKDGAPAAQQKPEDFMDEEDLREAEEARNLATTDGFAGFGSTEQDPMRSAGLMDILRPTGDTIGSRLLQRMGWKVGQGIGPKIMRKANMGDGEEAEEEETHLFAPENTNMISFSRKADYKGLGFEIDNHLQTTTSNRKAGKSPEQVSGEEENALSINPAQNKRAALKGISNRAFGVGVLNDTGSDDEDPYEIGPKISYSKVLGGEKKSKKPKDGMRSNANPFVNTKPTFLSKKLSSARENGFRRSRDGRLPLDGFVLADELDGFESISLQDDSTKPPAVPADWKSSKISTQTTTNLVYASTADGAKASSLNAQSRAALLGVKPLPGKSVFDFLSPAARSKLVSASGKINLPQAGNQPPPPGYEASEGAKLRSLRELVPALDSEVALQALDRGIGGWMPYAEDESKRTRYRSFLEIRAGILDELPSRAENATQDDWVNEMNEFARAAQVFKPVTGLMASRFTSSSTTPTTTQEIDEDSTGSTVLKRPVAKPDDPAMAAAKMGMFGPMTRSVVNFYPSRLVCKRFNVQPPDNATDTGDGTDVKNSSARQSQSSQFDTYQYEPEAPSSAVRATQGGAQNVAREVARQRLEQDIYIDPGENEALEQKRPGEEVFRAIFGSEDEGHDSED